MYRWRVDRALATLLDGWSRSDIGQLIRCGGVSIDGKDVRKGTTKINPESVISIDRSLLSQVSRSLRFAREAADFSSTGHASAVIPQNIELVIVYEDADDLIVDKPAGMVIHPAYANVSGTLANAVAGYFVKSGVELFDRIGLVHRLDKAVSGLVLIAKNKQALQCLSEQFSGAGLAVGIPEGEHKALKYYWAVVGPVSRKTIEGIGQSLVDGRRMIEGYMRRDPKDRKLSVFQQDKPRDMQDWRYARSYIRYVRKLDQKRSLLEVQIVTGRTHQIRAQLASVGLPIDGDLMYGGRKRVGTEGIGLRCVRISYIPPHVYKRVVNKGIMNGASKKGDAKEITHIWTGIERNKQRLPAHRVTIEREEVP